MLFYYGDCLELYGITADWAQEDGSVSKVPFYKNLLCITF